ncbi:MAG TPA: MFS transporter, partial [Chloroflexota bacterium]|nr:MFS transporter [Chloroflexota bacterium]
ADRGAIMGLYSIVLGLGQVLGGSVGGPFAQAWGLDGMAMLTLALGAIATATVLGLRRGR